MYIDGKIVQVCRRSRARRLGDSSTGTAARAAELLTTGDREDYYRKLALYILHSTATATIIQLCHAFLF